MWWSDPAISLPKSVRNIALMLALCLVTSACGFRPLYGEIGRTGAAQADLSLIEVDMSKERTGQRLRQILVHNLTPRGEPARARYRLSVALAEAQDGVGLRTDFTITRINYRLKGAFSLVDASTGAVIFSGDARGITAYNVGADQVATLTAEQDARERAANDLAEDIQARLAVFFESRAKTR